MNTSNVTRRVLEIVTVERPTFDALVAQLWHENEERRLGLSGDAGHYGVDGLIPGSVGIHGRDYSRLEFLVEVLCGAELIRFKGEQLVPDDEV